MRNREDSIRERHWKSRETQILPSFHLPPSQKRTLLTAKSKEDDGDGVLTQS